MAHRRVVARFEQTRKVELKRFAQIDRGIDLQHQQYIMQRTIRKVRKVIRADQRISMRKPVKQLVVLITEF